MPYDTITYEVAQSGVATIALNQPQSRNALSDELVVEVVSRALTICGIAGYLEDSPLSLGRRLRDAHGAALMVNNDRILGANAQMLLIHKGEK